MQRSRGTDPVRRSVTALRRSMQLALRAAPRATQSVIAAAVLSAVLTFVQLWALRRILAVLPEASSTTDRALLFALGLFLVAFTLSTATTTAVGEISRLAREASMQVVLRDLLAVADRVEPVRFDEPEFHDRLRRSFENASNRAWDAVWGAVSITTSLLTASAAAVVLFLISPTGLAAAVLAALPAVFVARRNGRLLHESTYALTVGDRQRGALMALFRSRHAAPEIRLMGSGPLLRRRIDSLFDERRAEIRRLAVRRIKTASVGVLAGALVIAVVIGVTIADVMGRPDAVAETAVALVALQQVAARLRTAATAYGDLEEAALFLDDMYTFAAEFPSEPELPADRDTSPAEIVVNGISFSYPSSTEPAVRDLDLSIRAGEIVAIVGRNGSGKTTLVRLLAGVYEPDAGRIRWNGVVRTASERRASTTALFQNYIHYPLTLEENVRMGDPARVGNLTESLEAAGAAPLVQRLPQGIDTLLSVVFDGGVELSGGEWQSIGLARAMYRHGGLLVLDEPSAALDPIAERRLFSRLRALAAGKTTIYISHRFTTVEAADRILVMDGGELIEDGTHTELIAGNGLYAELHAASVERA